MVKQNAIFIGAQENAADPQCAETKTPALLLCDSNLLRAVTTAPLGTPPREIIEQHLSSGPMQWSHEVNALTFACSYWRSASREWKPIFIHAKHLGRPFLDGAEAVQLHGELDDGTTVESIPLSIPTLCRLGKAVTSKKRFVIASELGVKSFNEFAAFEHLHLEAAKEAAKTGSLVTLKPSAFH